MSVSLRRRRALSWVIACWLALLASLAGATPGGPLVNGGSVTGFISSPGETITYNFSAQTGQTIRFRAAREGTSSLMPNMALTDASGRLKASASYSTSYPVASISYVAQESGQFTLSVKDSRTIPYANTGRFQLNFVLAPGANEGGRLISGERKTGTIDFGDMDSFTVDVNAGENVVLRMARTGAITTVGAGYFTPRISLYSPNGTEVRSDYRNPGVASVSYEAPTSGTYTIVLDDASGGNSIGAGTYKLDYVRTGPLSNAQYLASGERSSGTIETGELASFSFKANIGEYLTIRVAGTSSDGTLKPELLVYGPSGRLEQSNSLPSVVSSVFYNARATGVHTVIVRDSSSTALLGRGKFDLNYGRAPGANEGGTLVSGGLRNGHIDLGDVDSYTFLGNAGDQVSLTLSGTGTLAPNLVAVTPSGKAIGLRNFTQRLPESGVYTVFVFDDLGNTLTGTGEYSLGLVQNPKNFSYAALGDSYSSGEGVPPYRDATDGWIDGCHRSTRAYATLIKQPGNTIPLAARNDVEFGFFACSGATTENVSRTGEGQAGEPPQLADSNRIDGSRDLVTLSIGGNDAMFARIVAYCFIHNDCNSVKPFAPHTDITLGDYVPLFLAYVAGKVNDVHTNVRSLAPNAAVVVTGYPLLVGKKECAAAQLFPTLADFRLSVSEMEFLRDANHQLNLVLQGSAAAAGVHFVSVEGAFEGHEICGDKDPWINGVYLPAPKTSFHPNARGQQEYANAINTYLDAGSKLWPFGLTRKGLPANPPPLLQTQARRATAAASIPTFSDLSVQLSVSNLSCRSLANLVVPGSSVSLSGTGFMVGETIEAVLLVGGQTYPIGRGVANATGALLLTAKVPAGLPAPAAGAIEVRGIGKDGLGMVALALVRLESSTTIDSDGDGVPDLCDNCRLLKNKGQLDTNSDGYGNRCDADLNRDGVVSNLDLALFRKVYGSSGERLDADFNGDQVIDDIDLSIFKELFGKLPGPSGLKH